MVGKKRKRVVGNITWNRKQSQKEGVRVCFVFLQKSSRSRESRSNLKNMTLTLLIVRQQLAKLEIYFPCFNLSSVLSKQIYFLTLGR